MMEDEIKNGVIEGVPRLLMNRSFTYAVLALWFVLGILVMSSFDTAVYLLINNQFDILLRLDAFSVKPFDVLRVLDRYVDKLNQQSSFLVNGDVRMHYTHVQMVERYYEKIIDNIVDYAVWESNSEVWKYLGGPTLKVEFAVMTEE